MIQTIAKTNMPVDEVLRIRKNRIQPCPTRSVSKWAGRPAAEHSEGALPMPSSPSCSKRISIVTGIHGDELEGQFVCYEVARRIEEHPECLKGTVDIYPALNPFGIDSVTRGIPAFDLDMNRIFPGNSDGDMNEHLASEIIHDLEGSDLCLDIHASNIYLTEIPQIRINELHEETLLPLAKLSNVDFIWVHGASTVLESTLAYSLNSRGVPALVVEMGVGMRITREYGVQLTDGIFRLMTELGIWDGPTIEVRTPIISRDPDEVTFLNAPVSGIFIKTLSFGNAPSLQSAASCGEHLQNASRYSPRSGTMVKAGDEIGQIVDPLRGILLSTVTAPVDGWLFTVREYPVVDEGSLLARILTQTLSDPA
ncbi:MAG: M14 family metallopeptidase [Clostridiales bacterium]|nr:M14 family metallopeptidase [Clostridiales bacterium]